MTVLLDLRHALRQLKLAPMFTATVVLTLGLGIGACTAIFSLIDAVMLKSLPVTDPASLYQVGTGKPTDVMNGLQGDWDLYSFKLYKRLEQSAKPEFDQVAAFQAHELPGRVHSAYHWFNPRCKTFLKGSCYWTVVLSICIELSSYVGYLTTFDSD